MPYELDGEAASVAVPESTVFLSDEQVSNLSSIVPSLDESENYGINLGSILYSKTHIDK